MKIECPKDKFKEAVNQSEKITGKNLTLPILSSILIQTESKNIILKSTNLDVGLEIKVPAKIEKEGGVAVPGGILSGFLSGISGDENIKMELVNGNLCISTKKNTVMIKSHPTDDFPIIPKVEGADKFVIDAKKFVDGIRSVIYCASASDMKPEISSVYIYKDVDEIIFASTDSFRLAEKRFSDPHKDNAEIAVILPYKNAIEAARMFESSDEVLNIFFSKNQFSIVSDTIYFTSRIVGGVFPDYAQIMPKDKATDIVVMKKDLIDSIRISNIFSDKLNQITLKVIKDDSLFEVSSSNQDKGESTTRVDATVEGDDVDIHLNAKYLLDCLPSITTDSINIIFNGQTKPIMIKGIGDRSFVYLVMPMNK